MATRILGVRDRKPPAATFVVPCALAAICGGLQWSFVAHAADQPNIVLIFSDDAGYNDFGFNAAHTGSTTTKRTPRLDALAAQSVVLTNGYVSAPVCSPSRAGLLTGQYQQRFGYERNTSNGLSADDGLPAGKQLISHYLQNEGYTTGVVGKWHQGSVDGRNRPLDMGFDEFFGMFKGSRSYWGIGNNNNAQASIRRSIGGDEVIIETTWVHEGDSSLYDPTNGRYLTDAFSEESVAFIDNHAADADPFFLYVPYSATHGPNNAKQQDLDQFPTLSGTEKTIAAMTMALDRGVGSIIDALQANGIDDNTIVIFANDNGGTSNHDNTPLRGNKGSTWEGGTRVAYTIMAPGLQPSTFASPVTTRDLVPTLVAAAGGDVSQLDVNGVDLMPYLNGTETADPHEILFWRHTEDWAVRKGDWKLVRTDGNSMALYDLANDLAETTDLQSQQPAIAAELVREFTYWEATLDKPHWGTFGADDRNRFDHFVFQVGQVASANWSDNNIWREGGTSNNVTMINEDAYANAILEFGILDDGEYTATNNMSRMTGQTFMLNEIRLTGVFTGTANRTGTINGDALLFVNNLSGQGPRIHLDATGDRNNTFTFRFDNNIDLLEDLVITGDGTQTFVIGGDISDYFEPRNVTKTGVSSVTLTGRNTFGGALSIQGGEIVLADGLLSIGQLNNLAGGTFQFIGGTLQTPSVQGSLENNGGTFAPGKSPGITTVTGDYTQNTGTLEIEIEGLVAGSDFDILQITGDLTAGGTLQVLLGGAYAPQVGQMFEVVTADSANGQFLLDSPADLDGNDVFAIHHNLDSVVLEVISSFLLVDGDLTFDGIVNVDDWQILQPNLYVDTSGLTLGEARQLGDFNGDRAVDRVDFVVFKDLFNTAHGAGSFEAMLRGVPEPSSWVLIVLGGLAFLLLIALGKNRGAGVVR